MNTCLRCQKKTKNRRYCCRTCSNEGQKSNPKRCKVCNNVFPKRIIINGKRINLQRRKHCFECSPFGYHNTKTLSKACNKDNKMAKKCTQCGNLCIKSTKLCPTCYFNQRKNLRAQVVDNIVGTSCWICDYNKCRYSLHFHHLDPSIKKFSLNNRSAMLKWDRVLEELKKCILVCANCHGEIHTGLIDNNFVINLHKTKWDLITTLHMGNVGFEPTIFRL